MGLKLSYSTPNGMSGNHWSISEVWINAKELKSYVIINLFKDKATKDAGNPPLPIYKRHIWDGADFPFDEDALKVVGASDRTISYAKIKATPMPQDENGNDIGDIDWTQATDED